MLAGRALRKILQEDEFSNIEIEEIDVVSHPARAWQDGIRMIPALKNGKRIFSALLASEKDIRSFLRT